MTMEAKAPGEALLEDRLREFGIDHADSYCTADAIRLCMAGSDKALRFLADTDAFGPGGVVRLHAKGHRRYTRRGLVYYLNTQTA